MIGIDESNKSTMQNLSFENEKIKYGLAKTLFISDSDKRKYINLNIKIMSTNNSHQNSYIGLFQSRKMKVISKPSCPSIAAASPSLKSLSYIPAAVASKAF